MYLEIVGDGARIVSDVCEVLQEAMKVNQLFTSPHHGYAIILEELDELWDEVRKKESKRDIKNMRSEAVQVAAMAMKFIMSMENDWKPIAKEEEKELKNEPRCGYCRYSFMTEQELSKMDEDPCLATCGDASNWKPKEEDK